MFVPIERAVSESESVAGRGAVDGEDEGVVTISENATAVVSITMPRIGVAGGDFGHRALFDVEVKCHRAVAAIDISQGKLCILTAAVGLAVNPSVAAAGVDYRISSPTMVHGE